MRRAVWLWVLSAVAFAGCAPRPGLEVSLQDYNSDILFGAKAKLPELPPAPPAVLSPTFPGFIQPPVVVRDVLESVPQPPPPPLPPPVCKTQDVKQVPPPPAPAIAAAPVQGTYSYRLSGSASVGGVARPLPDRQARVLRVSSHDQALTQFTVVIEQGAGKITTDYMAVHGAADPTLDGLYIRRVVMEEPGQDGAGGGGAQVFEPVAPGLRIFAQPAAIGTTWTSAAADPLHGITMRLSGAITQIVRLSVCGEFVEGWESTVGIDVVGLDSAGRTTDTRIDAVYVVAPQLGGLLLSDAVTQTGTERGDEVSVTTQAVVENLKPRPLPIA